MKTKHASLVVAFAPLLPGSAALSSSPWERTASPRKVVREACSDYTKNLATEGTEVPIAAPFAAAPRSKPRLKQVQTPAGYQMVEYDGLEDEKDPVEKYGIKAARHPETWKKASEENWSNSASPFGDDIGDAFGDYRYPTSSYGKKKTKLKQVRTPAGYQMVEYDGLEDEKDPVEKYGVKAAKYAETWKKTNEEAHEYNWKNTAADGTEIPVLGSRPGHRGYKPPGKDYEFVDRRASSGSNKVRLKHVQTAAGFQMVEVKDDGFADDRDKYEISPRAEYAETWAKRRENPELFPSDSRDFNIEAIRGGGSNGVSSSLSSSPSPRGALGRETKELPHYLTKESGFPIPSRDDDEVDVFSSLRKFSSVKTDDVEFPSLDADDVLFSPVEIDDEMFPPLETGDEPFPPLETGDEPFPPLEAGDEPFPPLDRDSEVFPPLDGDNEVFPPLDNGPPFTTSQLGNPPPFSFSR